jgi:hypothetical protein
MQDCTWLTKLQIDKFYENDVLFRYVFWKPSWCWSLQLVLQHNDAATIQMKEIVTENTLYRNLYLAQLPNGFDAHFITQLMEK